MTYIYIYIYEEKGEIIYHNQVRFIPRIQSGFTFEN